MTGIGVVVRDKAIALSRPMFEGAAPARVRRVLATLLVSGLAACSDGARDEGDTADADVDAADADARPPDSAEPAPGVTVIRPIALTDDARLPEADPDVVDVEVLVDRLVVHVREGADVDLAAGHVVAGVKGGGYLRRVSGVTAASATTLEVTTTAAALTDLVSDGAFSFRQARGEAIWTSEEVDVQPAALESRVQVFTPRLWQGLQCAGTGTSGFSFTPVLDFDLDLEVDIDIRPGAFGGPGRLHSALFAVAGDLDVGSVVKATESFGVACQLDLIRVVRERLGNPDLLKWERRQPPFLVGPVPIVLVHAIEPVFQVSIAGQATEAGLETRDVTTYALRAGAEYRDGAWRGIWSPSTSGELTVRTPPEVGDFSVTIGAAAGIQYKVLVWDVAGPKISLEGVTEGKLVANPVTCTWSATAEAGLNAVVGAELNIPVFDTTIADYTATFQLAREAVGSTSGRLEGCTSVGDPPTPSACDPCAPGHTYGAYTEARIAEGRGPRGAAFWRRKVTASDGTTVEDRFDFVRWLPDDANTPPGQSKMLANHRYTTCGIGGSAECTTRDTEVTLVETGQGPAGVAQAYKVGYALAHGGEPRCTMSCEITRDDGTTYTTSGPMGSSVEYECVGCGNSCTASYYTPWTCRERSPGDCANAAGNGSMGAVVSCP